MMGWIGSGQFIASMNWFGWVQRFWGRLCYKIGPVSNSAADCSQSLPVLFT